MAAKIKKFPF
jgi:hypothetical protein